MITRYFLIAVLVLLLPTVLASQEKEEEEENPHTGMVDDEFVCLDCHTEVPKEGMKSPTYFLVDEPSENCLGCHDETTHPGSKEHIGQNAKPLPGDQEGKVACFTCHDPHGAAPTRRDACRSCHEQPKHRRPVAAGQQCDTCHMPLVKPVPGLQFANHWIGIYTPGALLLPKTR